jgi:lysophospholipase L1-like esterase
MFTRKPIQPSDTVFLGDSITEGFVLERYFNRNDLKNRGTSGDTTHQVLYRLNEITDAKPARLFLMIGINDLFNGDSDEEVLANIRRIVERILEESPSTRLYIQSILPVNETILLVEGMLNVEIYKTNQGIENLCKEKALTYIDLHSAFLNDKGQLDTDHTYDGGHLSETGYALWAKEIKPYLA